MIYQKTFASSSRALAISNSSKAAPEGNGRDRDDEPRSDDVFGPEYFIQTYGDSGLKKFGLHWWSVRWYAKMVDRCLREIGGQRVLEIGCGQGFMLARLEGKYSTFGIDLSGYAIEQTARFAPKSTCAVANFENDLPPKFESENFDVIVAKYVFEHLDDPLRAMQRAEKMLRPGGIIFFSVPNTLSLGARHKGEAWFAHPAMDPTHCSLLSPAEWRQMVRNAGLIFCKESADGYWDIPYFKWLPSWAQLPVFIGPTALSCLSGRAILPPGFGENLLIFARKPDSAT
jgi:2-polyprenyl-3-methyl-5-hydroxy-6-metoxy-1,4-benzoquinol methylase